MPIDEHEPHAAAEWASNILQIPEAWQTFLSGSKLERNPGQRGHVGEAPILVALVREAELRETLERGLARTLHLCRSESSRLFLKLREVRAIDVLLFLHVNHVAHRPYAFTACFSASASIQP